jgi:hypothetical protein
MNQYVPAVRHSFIERVKDGNAAGTEKIDPT